MLNVLITGASGFVGQHLLEDIDTSRWQVSLITRTPGKKMRVQPAGIKVLQADLNNRDSLLNAFKGIDVLINTAAEVRDLQKLAETNINGTKNLIDAIVQNRIPRLIHLSSVGVVGMQYSSSPAKVDEQWPCDPKNEYERTKLESERLLIEASMKHGFELVILRPTNVFGEFHPYNALLNMMQHISAGKPLLYTKGAMVNYVYVKDLAAAILKALNNKDIKGILNVGEPMPLEEFGGTIAYRLNKNKRQLSIPQFLVNFMNMLGLKKFNAISNRVEYSDALLKKNFSYPYGISAGLERTVAHYKKKGSLI